MSYCCCWLNLSEQQTVVIVVFVDVVMRHRKDGEIRPPRNWDSSTYQLGGLE